jgi:hypothetical protein
VPNIGYCLSKCDYDKERDRNNLFLNIKKWGCHAYNVHILRRINGSNKIELYSINKIMGASLICDYWELEFPYWSPCYAGKDYLPSLNLLCGINYSTCKQIGGLN